jgi:uncharacterized protein
LVSAPALGAGGREFKSPLPDQSGGVELSPTAITRTAELMAKYADLPMDLADATLVAYAEEHAQRRVFTLDSDFDVYRLHGRQRFEVVPGG